MGVEASRLKSWGLMSASINSIKPTDASQTCEIEVGSFIRWCVG